MHGYELKQHLNMLVGYYQQVSDGALYPAITRLTKKGFIEKTQETGSVAAPRNVLYLTSSGKEELFSRLKNPAKKDISDSHRFFTYLTFLNYLNKSDQKLILQERLTFLQGGKSFFQKDGRAVTSNEEQDIFRKGMLHIAKETSRIERAWIIETIEYLDQEN